MTGTIETRPLSDAFGVEVSGVDTAQPIDPAAFGAVLDAFHAHGVLLFRGQHLTPEALIAFSRNFGKIDVHIDRKYQLAGYPEIIVVGNVIEDGRLVSLFVNVDEEWHTDRCYMRKPSLVSLFYCVEAPPEGGDTKFAGAQAAYDALPDDEKARIDGLRAIHSFEAMDRHLRTQDPTRAPMTEAQRHEAPPVAQPIARTHPVTGRKSLYLSPEVIECVEGQSEDQGRKLIRRLTDHATQPQFVYRHKWRVGDLVVWDNRCTLHTATAYDADTYRRVMWRTTIEGDVPY